MTRCQVLIQYSFPGRGFHISTFSKLTNTFTKSLIMQFGHPHFKWLISTHIRCLNIFCTPTWNGHAIFIHFFKSQAKSCLWNEKTPRTCFIQMIISSSFIQAWPELLTTHWDSNSSWFRFYFGCMQNNEWFQLGSICFNS